MIGNPKPVNKHLPWTMMELPPGEWAVHDCRGKEVARSYKEGRLRYAMECANTEHETGMTPAELGKVYKLAKAWHYAQSLWNTAMDSRDPDMADRADTEIAKAQGELYGLMDTLNKGK